jgi:hypothetical protein
MTEPGPAQLELIRRYARTMRELHADAMAARGPRIGAREARRTIPASESTRQAAAQQAMGSRGAAQRGSGQMADPAH